MDKNLHKLTSENMEEHWWLVSRRKIIETVIKKHVKEINPEYKILDIGCGTGGNFNLLSKYSQNIIGLENDPYAANLSKEKYNFNIIQGNLPDNIPFPDENFDLITLFDVLEHVDDDETSLKNILAKIKPGGHFLLTVPAYQFLWSDLDVINDHKRRYTLKELSNKVKQSGLNIKYKSYFNTWLFPLISLVYFLKNHFGIFKDTYQINFPSKPVNFILKSIMSSERFIIKNGVLPFGVSIILLGCKE